MFRREVKILNGPQAISELRDMIIFLISVELVGDKNRLEAWGFNIRIKILFCFASLIMKYSFEKLVSLGFK